MTGLMDIIGIRVVSARIPKEERVLFPNHHFYDIRHADEDWGMPISVEPFVLVNHYGTLISPVALDIPEQDGFKVMDLSEDERLFIIDITDRPSNIDITISDEPDIEEEP